MLNELQTIVENSRAAGMTEEQIRWHLAGLGYPVLPYVEAIPRNGAEKRTERLERETRLSPVAVSQCVQDAYNVLLAELRAVYGTDCAVTVEASGAVVAKMWRGHEDVTPDTGKVRMEDYYKGGR